MGDRIGNKRNVVELDVEMGMQTGAVAENGLGDLSRSMGINENEMTVVEGKRFKNEKIHIHLQKQHNGTKQQMSMSGDDFIDTIYTGNINKNGNSMIEENREIDEVLKQVIEEKTTADLKENMDGKIEENGYGDDKTEEGEKVSEGEEEEGEEVSEGEEGEEDWGQYSKEDMKLILENKRLIQEEYGNEYESESDEEFDSELEIEGELERLQSSFNEEGEMGELMDERREFKKIETEEEARRIVGEIRQLGMEGFIGKYVKELGYSVVSLIKAIEPKAEWDFGEEEGYESMASRGQVMITILRYVLKKYLQKRQKLEQVNTVEDVLFLIRRSKKMMVLTGAGVSVSCGIPDFRSATGIYQQLAEEYGLDEPQQMFDMEYFIENPSLFYSFARQVYPDNYEPSPSHHFIKLLEEKEKLLRNYTQNIDTLEQKVGIEKVLNCHGSFNTATCIRCGYRCEGKDIKYDIMSQRVSYCKKCNTNVDGAAKERKEQEHKEDLHGGKSSGNDDGYDDDDDDEEEYGVIQGVMKPDIVFFGEKLPKEFDERLKEDLEQVDLLIVMGSSLKVAPVSEIMTHLPPQIPQIAINRTPITHMNFDAQLLGNSDEIVSYLCYRLGWNLYHPKLLGGCSLSPEYIDTVKQPISNLPDSEDSGKPKNGMQRLQDMQGLQKDTVINADNFDLYRDNLPPNWHLFEGYHLTIDDIYKYTSLFTNNY
ncbi:NAD-dependent histone deacetylase Sir2 [Zancudomyces culisetae]|uniref:NAD-dependent histone deacetylase Sir2 n=1 Tax=Zancudomyces culisetae TaxID=1213189 RepID=A0A1R1PXV2_ZANCU|nr:NAD-dependent histone deacetylase Sir2 [Zancudomyces culisetae]|eukprot:OMH85801.1 NAD-dependent histone deacetylase Sir2 [Zancudomyces culisetae]